MIAFFQYVYCCAVAYRNARRSGRCEYVGLTFRGVPNVCVFVGVGREAWRISQDAANSFRWNF